MKIGNINIEESDIQIINSIIKSYQEVNDTICELQKQIDEIGLKKQQASDKLESLKAMETNFLEHMQKKYNNKFSTQDLLKIILNEGYESSNMCNC